MQEQKELKEEEGGIMENDEYFMLALTLHSLQEVAENIKSCTEWAFPLHGFYLCFM